MHELRKDITTGNWVVLATDRAKRPMTAKTTPYSLLDLPPHDPDCPFCPGNENQTPPEIYAQRDSTNPDEPGWSIRIFPNKYPALVPNAKSMESSSIAKPGCGFHEVVVETPTHNLPFGAYEDDHVTALWHSIFLRITDLSSQGGIESVTLFKNSGVKAGISLHHPHAQIAALPIVPPAIVLRKERLDRHFRRTGDCLICDMLKKELDSGARIVQASNRFVTLAPYAPRVPYELWIIPIDHSPRFAGTSNLDVAEFGNVVRDALAALWRCLGPFDYNLSLIDGGKKFDPSGRFHFMTKITPRLTAIAGFELGTEIFMNTHCPEDYAPQIKKEWKGKLII